MILENLISLVALPTMGRSGVYFYLIKFILHAYMAFWNNADFWDLSVFQQRQKLVKQLFKTWM